MARPRVFISSTYYDLKYIRSSLARFIETLGFEPVLSEQGNITYSPNVPLDESCYREARGCDILVLVIGGRYGSPVSSQRSKKSEDFYDEYESITQREYKSAAERGIPIYIFIDKSVYGRYEVFTENREKKTVKSKHVDSVNILKFIDQIHKSFNNNLICQFDTQEDIENFLRQQWAGRFKEMLAGQLRKTQTLISDEVAQLRADHTIFKRYFEEIISNITQDPEVVRSIKEAEKERAISFRRLQNFLKVQAVSELIHRHGIQPENARDIFADAESYEHLASLIEAATDGEVRASQVLDMLKEFPYKADGLEDARSALGLSALSFQT
ncbi:MAG: DUF4062 domain-containing protein [Waddliaceae bacterium]